MQTKQIIAYYVDHNLFRIYAKCKPNKMRFRHCSTSFCQRINNPSSPPRQDRKYWSFPHWVVVSQIPTALPRNIFFNHRYVWILDPDFIYSFAYLFISQRLFNSRIFTIGQLFFVFFWPFDFSVFFLFDFSYYWCDFFYVQTSDLSIMEIIRTFIYLIQAFFGING